MCKLEQYIYKLSVTNKETTSLGNLSAFFQYIIAMENTKEMRGGRDKKVCEKPMGEFSHEAAQQRLHEMQELIKKKTDQNNERRETVLALKAPASNHM